MTIDGEEQISAVETQLAQQNSSPSLFTRTLQKPLGIGIIVGTILGVSNSLILGLPLLSSIGIGGVLGLAVCLFGCPGMMKGQIAARRELESKRRAERARRQRILKAFTSFD
jgi:Mg/Co/Ni transporter MgtE